MATRRRKVPQQGNVKPQIRVEELDENSQEIVQVFEENQAPVELNGEEGSKQVPKPVLRTPPEPVKPKKHPRNTPRFSREIV